MPLETFRNRFGAGPAILARAPGRVNLIGDHTDYNGGFVMPAAINRDIRIVLRPSDDNRVELFSMDFDETASFSLDALDKGNAPSWAIYVMGVADILQKEGFALKGSSGVLKGTVPLGAGLSSSAALEAAAALAFCGAAGLEIPPERLARICQRAENEFVGMNCGIMDQFASLLGRTSSALFLDCETLKHQAVPLDETQAKIVVCDTRVKRELIKSPYNERRRECDEALALLRAHLPELKSYHNLSVPQFNALKHLLPETLLKRTRHVVTENGRVLYAVKALQRGDLVGFGAAMDASHESLKNDFEVSCRELDTAVELARECEGVFGARMTGAGFGGCAVALVRPDVVDAVAKTLSAGYEQAIGHACAVHVFQPSAGASLERMTV